MTDPSISTRERSMDQVAPSLRLEHLAEPVSRPIPELVRVQTQPPHVSGARFRKYMVLLEVIADFATVTLAVVCAYLLYHTLGLGKQLHYPRSIVLGISASFAFVIVLMLDRVGAYSGGTSLLRVRETEYVLRVSVQALGFAFAVSFFTSFLFSRWLLVIAFGLVPSLLFLEKHLLYLLVQYLHSKGYGIEHVLIYGSGSTGRRVYSLLRRSPKLGLDPVAFVDDNPTKVGCAIFELGYQTRKSASIVRGPLTRELVRQYGADLVIIAIPSLQHDDLYRTMHEAFAARARVSFVPSYFLHSDPSVAVQDMDGILLASFDRNPRRLTYEWAKRVCDFGGAGLLLLLASPLFLLIAILIKLDSKGPAFFRQERVGRHGRQFRMFKFRTMYTEVPAYAYSPKDSEDSRITKIGRFLRRTSLDELPQLLNVLTGSMSLVGPRPEMPFIVQGYNERHRLRLMVSPGITGLWQLSGDRNYLIHENLEYDLYYIQYRNFFMDLAILLHTPIFAMRGM
jgi:exopolysaccharide biosynthesis polyprenyl glycosylphosphotransferase